MSVLRGLQVQLIAQFLEGVFRSVLLIILVLLAWWRTSNFHAGSALDQYVIATAATVLFGIALVYLKRPADLILNRPEFRSREWMSTSTALLFTGGMHLLHSQADILVLGAMRPPNEVAHYGVASRISGLLAMGLGAVTVIVAPKMAEMHGHNESRDKFQSYLRDATRLLMIFTLGLGGILTLIGIPILSLFGEEYIVAYWPLVVLIVGRAIDSGAVPTGQLMAMTGRLWQVSIIVLLSAMVNLAMNVLLIPPLGAMGAAIATAISFFIWNIALLIYAWRQLGLNPSILPNYFVKEFD